MKKISLSIATIVFTLAALMLGSTTAFFSDTETSTGNTFTAGAIDLKIDNESYYNGDFSSSTSWTLTDLTIEKFFDFDDIKPEDYGEDTISLHVDTNDAYLCADVTLTSNEENEINEPEEEDGDTTEGAGEGELADNVNFLWWADDGDNVLETDESVVSTGPLGALEIGTPHPVTLADSDENIWTGAGGPVPGEKTLYIGKAWCFGEITPAPLSQSSTGARATSTPAEDGNGNQTPGEPADGGFLCDGSSLDNTTQSDSLTADVSFMAVQARNNPDFQCEEPTLRGATLTLLKTVINDDLGTATDTDFTLIAAGPTPVSGPEGATSTTNASVAPGDYTLTETGPIGYVASLYSCVINGGAATSSNNITLASGDTAICTITNNDSEPLACEVESLVWADSVVSADQGNRKNGTPILAARTDPTKALGPAETAGLPSDVVPPGSTFYSLGFNVGTTSTRSITVSFDNNIILNGAGADVRVYEVTGGVYPDETATVEASQNGITWTTLVPNAIRDEDLDLGALAWAKYIRVVDITPLGSFEPEADGYDVDAVRALNCAQVPNIIVDVE